VLLAEQGVQVTAIDIDDNSLLVAKERCKIYNGNVEFINLNATQIKENVRPGHFDLIIFYASLEHMTHEERIKSIGDAWNMLLADNLLWIMDTLNRLWYYDSHTSLLSFYYWLSDNLAFEYSQFSPGENFNNLYREYSEEAIFHFLRRGRDISFHEFELSMDPVERLNIVGSMSISHRKCNPMRWLKWRFSFQYRYESMLHKIRPDIHRGFYQPLLDLIIKKG
jgi:S-adenosylmethionine-dependent methyltransferase